MTSVSVCIPSIPPRAKLLARALTSVALQSRPADQIVVQLDPEGRGAGWTRSRALESATSEWVAFLDDDDEFLPSHIADCLQFAEQTSADLVFPWFTVIGGRDPFPQHFGKKWNPQDPTHTTITVLVRREAALAAGGFDDGESDYFADGNTAGEDWRFILRLRDAGYRIEHLAERTWLWHHDSGNLSGRSWVKSPARAGVPSALDSMGALAPHRY